MPHFQLAFRSSMHWCHQSVNVVRWMYHTQPTFSSHGADHVAVITPSRTWCCHWLLDFKFEQVLRHIQALQMQWCMQYINSVVGLAVICIDLYTEEGVMGPWLLNKIRLIWSLPPDGSRRPQSLFELDWIHCMRGSRYWRLENNGGAGNDFQRF